MGWIIAMGATLTLMIGSFCVRGQVVILNAGIQQVIQRADNGDTEAQFELSVRYLDGIGVEKDEKKGVEYLLKSAEGGNPNAQVNAGHFYITGKHNLPKDSKKALEYFEKSAEQGNDAGLYNMGVMYMLGEEVEKSEEKAVEYYTKSASLGFPKAIFQLGRFTLFGKGGLQADSEKAFVHFQKAAEKGDVDAMDWVGTGYLVGWTQNKSDTDAFVWFLKSANAGNASAQCDVGWMYSRGKGVEKDYKQAVEWLTKSSAQDFNGGHYLLGLAYYYGQGVEKDEKKGLELIQKSSKDWKFWLEDKWDYRSSSSLAWVYYDGLTVEKDIKKALELFLVAAEAGEVESQYLAALILSGGRGVDADLVKAHMWLQLSGVNTPECSLANLELAMSPDQIAESKQLADEWVKKNSRR